MQTNAKISNDKTYFKIRRKVIQVWVRRSSLFDVLSLSLYLWIAFGSQMDQLSKQMIYRWYKVLYSICGQYFSVILFVYWRGDRSVLISLVSENVWNWTKFTNINERYCFSKLILRIRSSQVNALKWMQIILLCIEWNIQAKSFIEEAKHSFSKKKKNDTIISTQIHLQLSNIIDSFMQCFKIE